MKQAKKPEKQHGLLKDKTSYNVFEVSGIRNKFMETKNTTEKNINLLWQQ